MFESEISNYQVVLGDSNLKLELPYGVQKHSIAKALVHENYDREDSYHRDDVGFLILRSPARLEENVCLLCLPRPDVDIEEETCTVTGYGKPSTSESSPLPRAASYWEDKTTDGILREAELEILEKQDCLDHIDSDHNNTIVCAKNTDDDESQSACYHSLDGGSPLACESDGHHYLGGIVIFSSICGAESPSVFIKISAYVEWILQNYASLRYE